MGNKKISELASASSLNGSDTFPLVQAGTTKKGTLTLLSALVQSIIGAVIGPASSVDNGIALFDGTTGKLAKDSGKTISTDGTLAGNSDNLIPTQKAVKTYADALIAAADAMVFKGVIDCSANPNYPAADRGWTYRVSVAGKIGGASGPNVEVGDILLCLTDGTASGDHATAGSSWNIIQANIDGAVTGPASSTSGNLPSYNGTSGKVLQDSGVLAANVVTSGANITDNALVRGDGGAKGTQQTGIVVSDSDEISGYKGNVNAQTGTSYTLQASDTGKIVELTNASAITLTLPNSLAIGFNCTIVQGGAGQVTLSAASGATLRNRQSHSKLFGQWAEGALYVRTNSGGSAAEYVFGGDSAA